MKKQDYVHGYSERESERLKDQADTLTNLLHDDTRFPAGSRVLEAGCGIGAQTIILATNNPGSDITSLDISPDSLAKAEVRIREEGITNVRFLAGDIFHLSFPEQSFDHIFVCFVLEHLPNPGQALACLHPLLKKGGTLTVIEGDHGSTFFYPDSPDAQQAVDCLVILQQQMGGNALIGRELYPLLTGAGFHDVTISPRMVYVDASKPRLVEGFIRQTFTAMVEGVREEAIRQNLMTSEAWERGIRALYRTCEPDGVFCYTFFKATATK
jgi:SAM-dependent methyltransferase